MPQYECTHACLQVKAYGEMTVLVNRVGCSNNIKQDALHYMESVYSALGGQGRMSLERMAAACLYLAVRLCKVPVSLEDISTPAGKYVTGADCRKVSAELDKHMPPVNYDVHMQRNLPRLQSLYNSRKLVPLLPRMCYAFHHTSAALLLPIACLLSQWFYATAMWSSTT